MISEATGFNYIAIRRHIVGFNPCFLEGRDYRCKTAKLISKPFQSTLPRRERQKRQMVSCHLSPFQSTLPRRERRSFVIPAIRLFYVSIHAPTKGATVRGQLIRQFREVSIHAPTKGATAGHSGHYTPFQFQSTLPRRERRCSISTGWNPGSFNPRSHEGSDQDIMVESDKDIKFQSTLPRRERRKERLKPFQDQRFQSTLPRRERPRHARPCGGIRRFNPRSHEGSDYSR